MDIKKLQEDLKKIYNLRFKSIEKRVTHAIEETKTSGVDLSSLNINEIKALSSTILDIETKKLHDEVESLLSKKEKLNIELDKKLEALQDVKYGVFNAIQSHIEDTDTLTLSKLHQVKLQSVDIYDLLSEMVESAIITALEKSKDSEALELIQEVIKDLTYEAIKEGSLNTIRVRKILSTILASAIELAEATPNQANDILDATLKGMRAGLTHSIDRFKQRLKFTPIEAKHILIEDYDTIMQDLSQADTLFLQVVQVQANESSPDIKKLLIELNQKMHYDLEELVHISKEAAEVMKERFSNFAKTAVKKADTALKSQKAKEAKEMGAQAWGIAKVALNNAIKSAKDAINKR
ncbi:MAG: hypothetical protein L3I99_04225 [Sulfurimonas sp.]|nr:hypothetical protein [Sulfurimonas sp.]